MIRDSLFVIGKFRNQNAEHRLKACGTGLKFEVCFACHCEPLLSEAISVQDVI